MKKTYLVPTIEVIAIQTMGMLATSGGVANGSPVGDNYNGGDVSYSPAFDIPSSVFE